MHDDESVFRTIDEVVPVSISHGTGLKRVLTACDNNDSAITQIAVTILLAGEKVDNHIHFTMDEHFIFLKGEGHVEVEGNNYLCKKRMYIYIPAGSNHKLEAITDCEMITIGVKVNRN